MCKDRYIFQIKRIVTRLVCAYCLIGALAGGVSAKDAGVQTSLQSTIVSLSVNNERFTNVLQLIEKQSPFRFSYGSEIRQIGGITLVTKKQSLKSVLDEITRQASVKYWQLNDMIAIAASGSSDEASASINNFPLSAASVASPMKFETIPAIYRLKFDVKGRVIDESGQPMPGVSVSEKGSANGTVTDANGAYSIDANDGAVLVFSYIGYATKEVPVSAQQTALDVTLLPDVKKLDEVVVVGYGEQKKVSMTSAVTNINTREMVNVPTSNLSNVLAGRASGTFIQSGTGVPGKTSVVRIRSSSSWNSTGPLIVVDGIQRDQTYFDSIDPNQVADISVLKDAASAAIYGARSSDGVLLVTTKQGKQGKPAIQYNAVFGVYSEPATNPKFLSMDEAIDGYNAINDKPGDKRFNDYDRDWIRKNNPDGTLHFKEGYKTPSNSRHALNISGGNDIVDYFVAGNLYNEKGFLPQLTYQRYNLRSNVNIKVTKDLKLGLNLNYFNSVRNRFSAIGDQDSDLSGYYMKLYYMASPLSRQTIDGLPVDPGWVTNSLDFMNNGGYTNDRKQYTDAIMSLEYKVPGIKGLKLKGTGNLYSGNDLVKSYAKQTTLYTFVKDPLSGMGKIYTNQLESSRTSTSPAQESLGNENGKTTSYQLDVMAAYDTLIGNHHINAVGVFEQLQGYYAYTSLYKKGFDLKPADQFTFSSPVPGNTSANGYETYLNVRRSYVGRVQYDYKEKYLLSASLRADGSYKFAKTNRWGYFPAVSAGWVISKENFMTQVGAIELLKLRASYGTTGNDNVPAWMYRESYSPSANPYYMGMPGASQSVLLYNGFARSNFTWESAKSYNVGLDVRLFGHWSATADLWTKSTYNILGQRVLQTPIEFGASYPVENYGKMDAKGFELELGYSDGKIGNSFTFDVRGYVGLATTNVKAKDAPLGASPAEDPTGKPLNYATGYQDTGILRTDAEVSALPAGYKIFGHTPTKGLMNFKDVNGDNKIDAYDKVVVAEYSNSPVVSGVANVSQAAGGQTTVTTQQSNNAPISYGLTLNMRYKQFSINALFAGLAGYKVIYNDSWGRASGFGNMPVPAYYGNSYSEANPNGTFPLLRHNTDGTGRQDYTVVSGLNTFTGDFVRLKFLNIAYNFPESILKACHLKAASLFVGGTNLFTLRKFKLYDPELYNFDSYPITSSYTLGFNLQF